MGGDTKEATRELDGVGIGKYDWILFDRWWGIRKSGITDDAAHQTQNPQLHVRTELPHETTDDGNPVRREGLYDESRTKEEMRVYRHYKVKLVFSRWCCAGNYSSLLGRFGRDFALGVAFTWGWGTEGSEGVDNRSLSLILPSTAMSLEAARDLSISELLRVLNEKLDLECTRLRDAPFSLVSSTASLELEVTTR